MYEPERPPFREGDALVIVDVINDFEHDDGDALLASFRERLPAMLRAVEDARAAGAPVIYVNDDQDRWASDAPAQVRAAIESGRGGDVVEALAPRRGDPVILKHRYSAFDHTALDLLLRRLEIRRVVLIGAALEGCVVQTAIDAREHRLQVTILRDACASTDPELERVAFAYAEQVVAARLI